MSDSISTLCFIHIPSSTTKHSSSERELQPGTKKEPSVPGKPKKPAAPVEAVPAPPGQEEPTVVLTAQADLYLYDQTSGLFMTQEKAVDAKVLEAGRFLCKWCKFLLIPPLISLD